MREIFGNYIHKSLTPSFHGEYVMEKLKGVVELDECFIGGKEANKA